MWQVHHHMASSYNSIIQVHPNTTPLNPNAPVFQPLPPYSTYHTPFKRTPFYYCPQRWTWTWTYATSSAFPQHLYQYQQPRILSQYHWPYYFQGHHHHTTNESEKPTLLSNEMNRDSGVEETTTVMSKKKNEEEQTLVSDEKRGFYYWGRKRVIGPRMMKKPKGSIISDGSSTNINRNKGSSFYGKRWMPKQHMYDDQKGNVDPENNNINADIILESSEAEIIEADSIKCNDVCGPDVDNNGTLRCGKTAVMIRNVPNQFGRQHLLKILDEHCRRENMKIGSSSGIDPCLSEYDFVYLPIDYRRGLNKGYAFVNFTTNTAAVRFWQAFDQFKWEYYQLENSKFRSRKICQICWAKCQGKEALRDNFRSRVFPEDEYRPVTLEPPSDGRGTTTSQRVLIGYKRNGKMRLEPAVASVS